MCTFILLTSLVIKFSTDVKNEILVRRIKRLSLLFTLLATNLAVYPQNADPILSFVEIARIPNYKSAVVTLTFDDGSNSQFKTGLQLLDKYNLKATYFVITSGMGNDKWDKMRSMVLNGHEIGSHTVNHPKWISTISLDSAKSELEKSKIIIEKQISNYKCLTFCYPYGAFSDPVVAMTSRSYIGARTTKTGFNSLTNLSFYRLKGYFMTGNIDVTGVNGLVDQIIKKQTWLIEGYHGFNGEGSGAVNSDSVDKHFAYIKANEDKLWVTTFGDAIKYFRERNSSKFYTLAVSPNLLKFIIINGLPDSIYNYPLTLNFLVPDLWKNIYAREDSKDISFGFKSPSTSHRNLIVNVRPNKIIEIGCTDTFEREIIDCFKFSNIYAFSETSNLVLFPNPVKEQLNFLFSEPFTGKVFVYNDLGQSINNFRLENSNAFLVNFSNFPEGVYNIVLRSNNGLNKISRRVFKQK